MISELSLKTNKNLAIVQLAINDNFTYLRSSSTNPRYMLMAFFSVMDDSYKLIYKLSSSKESYLR
jgi:hypothetical protein